MPNGRCWPTAKARSGQAQKLIGSVLREAYLWYARCGAVDAAALSTASLVLLLLFP
jgi:hypothetical protein